MEDLEKLQAWLLSYPQWGDSGLYLDYNDGIPGSAGLYPAGIEELSRQTDLLGNVLTRNRCSFALYRVVAGQQDNEAQAAWLLEFQNWVQQQSAMGLAPRFGDGDERMWAQKGRLKEASQTGTGIYVVTLIAEFTKHYEKE